MIAGRDYIGVGVGAMVFNREGKVLCARRGPEARNEIGCWEFPGGTVEFGEKLADALIREFVEEFGMKIEVLELLSVTDHILEQGREHWVSPTFIAIHISCSPQILEPMRIVEFNWFSLGEVPRPRTMVTEDNLRVYLSKYGLSANWYNES